jgi:hypothetical protein
MYTRIGESPAVLRHGVLVLLCMVGVPGLLLGATSAGRWLTPAGDLVTRLEARATASARQAVPSSLESARYVAGTAQRVVFDALVARRATVPQERLGQRAALDEAAHAHLAYLIAHGNVGSAEQPGAPGFTGSNVEARVRAAGYHGEVIELVVEGSGRDCAAAVGSARLAGTLQQPRWRDVGVAAADGLCVVVLGQPAVEPLAQH